MYERMVAETIALGEPKLDQNFYAQFNVVCVNIYPL